jgi:hypothetical protein
MRAIAQNLSWYITPIEWHGFVEAGGYDPDELPHVPRRNGDLTAGFSVVDSGARAMNDSMGASDGSDTNAFVPDEVLIDDFDSGRLWLNRLGGLQVVYHENGDPMSLQPSFVAHGNGRAMGLEYDFSPHPRYAAPPQFVGYATRLQYADWRGQVGLGYRLCLDAYSDGNACSLALEVKRLALPPRETTREEVAKWDVGLRAGWQEVSLRLSDIEGVHARWDNLWEICFVIRRDCVSNERGLIQIDNLRLSR